MVQVDGFQYGKYSTEQRAAHREALCLLLLSLHASHHTTSPSLSCLLSRNTNVWILMNLTHVSVLMSSHQALVLGQAFYAKYLNPEVPLTTRPTTVPQMHA